SLQKEGGYAPIAANHKKYVVGLAGWLNSASRQMASFSVMDGHWTAAAIVAALLIAVMLPAAPRRSDEVDSPQRRAPLLNLFLVGLSLGILSLCTAALLNLAVLSLIGLATLLV